MTSVYSRVLSVCFSVYYCVKLLIYKEKKNKRIYTYEGAYLYA